jgi:hypothetical protein
MLLMQSLLFLVICIILFVICWYRLKKDVYIDVNDSSKCTQSLCGTDTKCCTIWDNGTCRKGDLNGFTCASKGDITPLIFGILGIISFVFFIVFMLKKKSITQTQ